MKSKRFLAVVLAAFMTITAVLSTGCAKQDNSELNEKSGIITLNMFVITEQQTSQEAAKAVQMAINEITVPKHKMMVKINYVTEDEYWDVVDAEEKETIEYNNKNSKKNDKALAIKEKYLLGLNPSDDIVAEENVQEQQAPEKLSIADMSFNDAIDMVFDMEDIELYNSQIDVLVVNDHEKFLELVEDDRVSQIDIKYDRKIVTQYIHPTILAAATVDGKTYGIPANFAMNGEYEFLVFNKNLLDKYGYTVGDLKKIENMGEYFAKIKSGEPGVYPISDLPELSGVEIFDDILYSYSRFDTVSGTSFPVYLNNTSYMNYLKTIDSYKNKGYVASYYGIKDAPFAVELVKSTELIEREWTENGVTYQAYLYDIPRVTADSAFASAFCVSNYSMNKAKAAELIELFTIDSELANLLQYGIEGKHYRLNEEGKVVFIETDPVNTYKMNNLYTGNKYIKYETADEVNNSEKTMENNLSTAPSSFFGFIPQFNDDAASQAIYECVKLFSATALDDIKEGRYIIDDVFNITSRQLNALGCVWDASGSNLLGVFGDLASDQSENVTQIASAFFLSEQAKTYNDIYKSAEELAAEKAALEAAEAKALQERLAQEQAELEAKISAEDAKNAEVEEPDPKE